MTEEGRNAINCFIALREEEENIKKNLIELDNYFNYSGKTEGLNKIMERQMTFYRKLNPKTVLFKGLSYDKRYVCNPNRTKPKNKLKK